MSELTPLLARSAGAVAAAMVLLWLVSLARRDASIADPFWGTGFALVAWTGLLTTSGEGPRRLLVVALTSIWGLRLSIHLLIRNLGHGEDPRYQAMRRRAGARFPLMSLFTVFLLQGALLWVVSLPLQAALAAAEPARLGPFDLAGAVLWAVGFFFEAVGDLSLSRFRADEANRGKVMDRGLWRYTRHPNYFGDALLWWGFGCFALSAGALWALVGPALMTFLLLRVSGVSLLERGMVKRRPDYQAYIDSTSAFIPWFPRRRPDDRSR